MKNKIFSFAAISHKKNTRKIILTFFYVNVCETPKEKFVELNGLVCQGIRHIKVFGTFVTIDILRRMIYVFPDFQTDIIKSSDDAAFIFESNTVYMKNITLN